jgi:hypothetical protein
MLMLTGFWRVPIHKWPIYPISALFSKFIPRNISHMYPKGTSFGAPMDKFFARLDLDQICLFLDGHLLSAIVKEYRSGTGIAA